MSSANSELELFYPKQKAEANVNPQPEPLQNATSTENISKKELSANQQADIEQIKIYLTQGLTEEEMAAEMGIHRTTISRKITAWMKTDDFDDWTDSFWLKLGMELALDQDTKVEVYKQLTRLKCAKTTKKVKADVTETIEANVKFSVNADLERYEAIIKQLEQHRSGANKT
jgi:predicted DNA-binding protein (UPF0251 family)